MNVYTRKPLVFKMSIDCTGELNTSAQLYLRLK